jgi:hypothetical protein
MEINVTEKVSGAKFFIMNHIFLIVKFWVADYFKFAKICNGKMYAI